ncbi:PTS mannose/fructose/sorbose transporter family subunit IID [Tuanshanicoccus lijuaniae]|uniref:PTS system mannose/fructose/sorbose family transporter subunit IID n=1 Tax=Aerococcaceae bacterium zg-1292 TaxID=2774330 RepID=UPI001935B6CE|nr:PTS mannose/fructose/sorbose transporter family subunit IID [Aerococcaceae bacterium zg-1292]MBF6626445.1 PTS mannose/fructose/sorbose transporter family subunit IID [Aerococcaceae bacterium zg-BR9]MBF6979190.1 PTS mannose/fructose/sorbose transporter family subunit IID [Aerococcaceae bacterium zg-BR22]MBS4455678.1 PTS mannose/fructose/sorbose transporter family subunit IID [Aerococcaceae bacterium zg-A91]MBS4457429.1 PTS mannose/fructose/sorbose transporter family subunit IID [Aerococcaceae
MTGSNKLEKKDYVKTSLRAFFCQNGFNYSNYQGLGYANVIYPALKKYYGDDEDGLYQALEENCEFYNTNPHFLPFITSLHLVMLEKDRPTEETRNIKMALMGPLAGIGDSLSQFCLAPLFSTIAASLATEGLILGPILFFIAMNLILTTIKVSTGLYGYKLGTQIIDKLSEQMGTISRIANIIGVTVISGLVANSVKITVPITFAAGEVNEQANQSIVSIQGMLDKVAPALLPILFTVGVYYLIKKKNWTTYKLVILTVIIGIIGSWLNILA